MTDFSDYKKIPNYKNYRINKEGDLIRIYKNGKVKHLKFFVNDNGYLRINLSKNGKVKPYYKHQLLAKTFIDNPEDKPCIDHINHNRQDNCLSNLKWVTYGENNRNKTIRYDNNTGHRGVSYIEEKYYVVNYSNLEGRNIRRKFSVKKYGAEEALKKAIEIRKKAEKLYYNYK
jgi:hypothetical protein